MKAAVLNARSGRFDIEDIALGEPLEYEVVVAIRASGLCHSDLHVAHTDYGIPLPAVLGHELAGVVEAVGAGVTEFAAGDHVVASLVSFCGHCGSCRDDRTYQCRHPEATLRPDGSPPKLTRDGEPLTAAFGTAAFAEFAVVHQNQLVRIPREIPFPQASLLGCGVMTGVGAVRNAARVRPGETVVIIGAGGVGLNAISGARLARAGRIIAVDAQPAKEDLALRFGATDFIDASRSDPVQAVLERTGHGADHVFEVVGKLELAQKAMQMARKGGAVYILGMYKPGECLWVDVFPGLVQKQLTLRGVSMGSNNIKQDIPALAEAYLAGELNLDDLISQEIDIGQINEAYQLLESGSIARSVITSFHG